MTVKYIDLEVRTALIFHGFDNHNQAIEEHISEAEFVRKLVAIERIRSISEQYILVSAAQGREMYWEYNGSLDEIKQRLQNAGIDIA